MIFLMQKFQDKSTTILAKDITEEQHKMTFCENIFKMKAESRSNQ